MDNNFYGNPCNEEEYTSIIDINLSIVAGMTINSLLNKSEEDKRSKLLEIVKEKVEEAIYNIDMVYDVEIY